MTLLIFVLPGSWKAWMSHDLNLLIWLLSHSICWSRLKKSILNILFKTCLCTEYTSDSYETPTFWTSDKQAVSTSSRCYKYLTWHNSKLRRETKQVPQKYMDWWMPTDGEEVPFFPLTEFFCTVKYDLVLKSRLRQKKKRTRRNTPSDLIIS